MNWYVVPAEITSDATMLAMPSSLPPRGNFLPKNRMAKNATAGMTGISQAFSTNQPVAITGGAFGFCSEQHQPFISDSSSSAIDRRLR